MNSPTAAHIIARTAPDITLNGSELSGDQLKALSYVRVQRGLCVMGRATLKFIDPGFVLAGTTAFKLGVAVTIKADTTEIFSGDITGVSLARDAGRQPEIVVTADDKAYKLTRGTQSRTFLKTKYSDIISTIAGEAGLSTSTDSTTDVYDYLIQTGTNLGYVDTIARRIGFVWWVDGTTLNFKASGASVGAVTVTGPDQLQEISVRASGLRPTEVEVDGWDPKNKQPITATAAESAQPTLGPTFVTNLARNPGVALQDSKTSVGDRQPTTVNEAQAVAKTLLADARESAVIVRGSMLVKPELKPAVRLTLSNMDMFNGEFVVSEVEHVYTGGGVFTTRFVAGPNRPIGLVDTLGREEPDPGMTLSGLLVALVTANKDTETNLKGYVKVSFKGQPGAPESAWARLATIGAGNARGIVFLPEVGDEVIVGFENDDIRRPVVLGTVYNGKDIAPVADTTVNGSGKVVERAITSRTGHKIEFNDDDTADKQHILLTMKDGRQLRIGGDKVSLDTKDKPLTITGASNASIEIDQGGTVTIKAKNIKFEAQQNLELSGTAVTIKATQKVAVQSAGQAELKGVQTSVGGDGMLELKGGLVKIN